MHGQRNHRYLSSAQFWGKVRTAPRYTLVSLGSFPALREQGTTSVPGELYTVGPNTLADLDQLEGHPSFYQRATVELDDMRKVTAYLLPGDHHPDALTIKAWPPSR